MLLVTLAILYLLVAIAIFGISLATSDPGVLVRPAALAAALVWPLVVPAVIVVSAVSRFAAAVPGEGLATRHPAPETLLS